MKRLFIIQQESIAARYGVGTYVKQLVSCFDSMEWKVTVVELFALVHELIEEEREGVCYYRFPIYKERECGWSDINQYERSIFYLLSSQTFPCEAVYCHFSSVKN